MTMARISIKQRWRIGLVAAAVAAYWPVWHWFAFGMIDRPDDPLSLLALGTAAIYYFGRRAPGRALWVAPALALTLLYFTTFPILPRILQLVLALATVACLLGPRRGRLPNLGGVGLLALALPLMPTLQFYGGYPLRALAGKLALPMLRLAGFGVDLRGVDFIWGGRVISIDAPCSGVQMLWVAGFLCCALAAMFELRIGATLRLAGLTLAAVIAGNALRMATLFYAEAGVLRVPEWFHDFAGVSVFATVCGLVLWAGLAIRPKEALRCAC